jgi:putative ABC transport system permease protein
VVRAAFGQQGYLSAVSVRLESEQSFDGFAAGVTLDKVQGLAAERERAYYRKVSDNLSNTISVIGGLVASIFALGAILGATITMYGTVSQRRREIGVLRALGFERARVLVALLVESFALALAGGTLGLVLALCTQFLHFSTVNWATGQELVFRFLPTPAALGVALGIGIAAGLVGGFFPALKAARMPPTEAMRR